MQDASPGLADAIAYVCLPLSNLSLRRQGVNGTTQMALRKWRYANGAKQMAQRKWRSEFFLDTKDIGHS